MRRSGRARASLLPPLVGAAALFVVLLPALHRRASAQGFGWISPALLAPESLPGWADPRWEAELESLLSGMPEVSAGDADGLEHLRRRIAELSFVESAGPPEVLWPDGLRIDLVLREPVACIPVGRSFRLVSADGTLLPGLWTLPPRIGKRWMPVLGPLEDGLDLFAHARPGDFLDEDAHVAALDVALSMQEGLSEEEHFELGRTLIDARAAGPTPLEASGVRIDLEGRRRILFGRAPYAGEPGELEAQKKWRAVSRALALWGGGGTGDPGAIDWDLLDVRWDRPDIALRGAMSQETGERTEDEAPNGGLAVTAPPERPAAATRETGDRRPRVR